MKALLAPRKQYIRVLFALLSVLALGSSAAPTPQTGGGDPCRFLQLPGSSVEECVGSQSVCGPPACCTLIRQAMNRKLCSLNGEDRVASRIHKYYTMETRICALGVCQTTGTYTGSTYEQYCTTKSCF